VVSTGNEYDKDGITAPACVRNAIAVGATYDTGPRRSPPSRTAPRSSTSGPGRHDHLLQCRAAASRTCSARRWPLPTSRARWPCSAPGPPGHAGRDRGGAQGEREEGGRSREPAGRPADRRRGGARAAARRRGGTIPSGAPGSARRLARLAARVPARRRRRDRLLGARRRWHAGLEALQRQRVVGLVDLGGAAASTPECVARGDGRTDCFVTTGAKRLAQITRTGSAWGRWADLGGQSAGGRPASPGAARPSTASPQVRTRRSGAAPSPAARGRPRRRWAAARPRPRSACPARPGSTASWWTGAAPCGRVA
jgi:hypothetical protein